MIILTMRGKPTKYKPEFHPESFIALSRQGKSICQIASIWNVSRDTIYEWRNKHPEFHRAVKTGREFAEGWYMNLGQAAMMGEIRINLHMYYWLTRNMFKWRG